MREEVLDKFDCPHCRQGAGLRAEVFAREPDGEWRDGALTCEACGRWYPMREGIAELVPDGIRDDATDRAFVTQWTGHSAQTLNLGHIERTEEDRRIFDDSAHWGAFMRRFRDVGDEAIFDIRCKGSHTPLFVAGILERDTRDAHNPYGTWPRGLGHFVFEGLDELSGEWGVDVGCGGGQFGLEAARRGVRMIGFDPGFENVALAREHARKVGVAIDYVRADPRCPPFKPGVFGLVMAKDSLHHVPRLAETWPRVLESLRPRGTILVYEHVAISPTKRALLGRLRPKLVERARARHATVAVPGELLRDSANEDVSMAVVEPVVRAHLDVLRERRELLLGHELSMLLHFATRHRWASGLAAMAAHTFDAVARAVGAYEHWAVWGRKRG